MKCAIVDDDIVFSRKLHNKLETYLNKFFDHNQVDIISDEFGKIDYNHYDIIFMDIDLKSYNGIQLGKQINDLQSNHIIIFVSSLNECVFDALAIHPLFFMRKSHLEKDFLILTNILDDVLHHKFKNFQITINGRQIYIYNQDIQYISVAGHDITINTGHQYYTFRGSLSDILNKIHDSDIIQVSKSTAVNFYNIMNITQNKIILKNNTKIDIGRAYKENVNQKYIELLLR
ncbi:LytR/AlgR family response regulator transcription factor [Candidatus Stoquefichus massiliensis]|uniref:LytR/AlgR family response regulator transcription factor n=1 Tax=Candidatus Stoquefichus massiliensis TaxID=1470350 RepID=UPI0004808B55|nr:LytTR family DNA-binding domain-containing protein [Candidatus Stoquefichus massiliensis]